MSSRSESESGFALCWMESILFGLLKKERWSIFFLAALCFLLVSEHVAAVRSYSARSGLTTLSMKSLTKVSLRSIFLLMRSWYSSVTLIYSFLTCSHRTCHEIFAIWWSYSSVYFMIWSASASLNSNWLDLIQSNSYLSLSSHSCVNFISWYCIWN